VSADDTILKKAIPYVKTRVQTLVEFAEAMDYFYRDVVMDAQLAAKFLTTETTPYLKRLAAAITKVEPFTHAELDRVVRAWLEQENLKMKQVAQPARLALTGRAQSPGLFEVMEVLGKQETLRRLEKVASP
jgi:glutamyl-tRNA synthetase